MTFTTSIFFLCLCLPLGALGFPEIDPAETFCCLPDQVSGNVYENTGTVFFYVDYDGQWALDNYMPQESQSTGRKVAFDLANKQIYNLEADGTCTVFPLTRSLRLQRARCIPATANFMASNVQWQVNGEDDDFTVSAYNTQASWDGVCTIGAMSMGSKYGNVVMGLNPAMGTKFSKNYAYGVYNQVIQDCNSSN